MRKKIVLLVPDISDARVIKRIKAFQLLGADLIICGFQRQRYKFDFSFYVDIQLVKLGNSAEKNYIRRIPKLFIGLIILLSNLNIIKNSNCIYCINIDMLPYGYLLKKIYKFKLMYEVGDILNPFLGKGLLSLILRSFERLLLSYTDYIVVTSPAFYTQFFKPVQKLKIPWLLLENKLLPQVKRTSKKLKSNKSNKINIVYHGVLRDQKSIDILVKIAIEFNHKCDLHIYGYPLWVKHDELQRITRDNKNIYWHGEYSYPQDLNIILSDADLLWLIDLSENINNSKWLLPNRLYDGILFGVPLIARQNTETCNYINNKNIGWCLGTDIYNNLREFMNHITMSDILQKKLNLRKMPDDIACSLKQYEIIYDYI
jgi:glycosyltransferase involved in cell wall biosynthesis